MSFVMPEQQYAAPAQYQYMQAAVAQKVRSVVGLEQMYTFSNHTDHVVVIAIDEDPEGEVAGGSYNVQVAGSGFGGTGGSVRGGRRPTQDFTLHPGDTKQKGMKSATVVFSAAFVEAPCTYNIFKLDVCISSGQPLVVYEKHLAEVLPGRRITNAPSIIDALTQVRQLEGRDESLPRAESFQAPRSGGSFTMNDVQKHQFLKELSHDKSRIEPVPPAPETYAAPQPSPAVLQPSTDGWDVPMPLPSEVSLPAGFIPVSGRIVVWSTTFNDYVRANILGLSLDSTGGYNPGSIHVCYGGMVQKTVPVETLPSVTRSVP